MKDILAALAWGMAVVSASSITWWAATGDGWWTAINMQVDTDFIRGVVLAALHAVALLLPICLKEKTK